MQQEKYMPEEFIAVVDQAPEAEATSESQTQDTTVATEQSPTDTKVETKPEAETQTEVNGEDEPSETPRFKERVQKLEQKIKQEYAQKYETSAKNWEAINQIAATDPDFALTIVERMEKAGMAAPGTYEKAKAQLEASKLSQKEEVTGEQKAYEELISKDPAVQWAKTKLAQEQQEAQRRESETESFLQKFEEDRPGIKVEGDEEASTMNRQAIMLEAKNLMRKNKDLSFKDALDQGYRWVVKREDLLKEYREKGEITGLANSIQQGGLTATKGESAPRTASRALDADEQAAAKLMKVSNEEYLKYVGSNSGMVD